MIDTTPSKSDKNTPRFVSSGNSAGMPLSVTSRLATVRTSFTSFLFTASLLGYPKIIIYFLLRTGNHVPIHPRILLNR